MHLQKNQFAAAAALTMGAVYVVCSAFVAVFPSFSETLMGWLTHVINGPERQVTFGGFVGGLVQAVIYTYIFTWIFAALHNRFATR